jgi:hypothetical protein
MSKHEMTDADIPSIAKFGAGLFALIVVAMIAMWFLFQFLGEKQEAEALSSPLAPLHQSPPAPRLQVSPEQDLQAIRQAESEQLNSYGWIDRDAGIVHMPIGVAIERIVAEGLPSKVGSEDGTAR